MELFFVLLLLSLAGQDPAAKEKLRAALDFYRENRELLRSLAEEQTKGQTEKDSPALSGESLRVLDEFLKKL